MKMNDRMRKFISLKDMGIAYRKAKTDIFYSSNARKEEVSRFESRLYTNLKELRNGLINGEVSFELGKMWTLIPHRIKYDKGEDNFRRIDPKASWEAANSASGQQPKAEFRLMEKLSIDFHVLSVLWIHKVGHKFEERLTPSVRANRLRRDKNREMNPLSLGSTDPYLRAYSEWRDDALSVIENALDDDASIVVINTDVSSFYHNIDVRFMLDEDFINKIGVDLNDEEWHIHLLFIKFLYKWSRLTPIKKGLPVGLTASSIIANVALFELDELIESEVVPLYYGRYVDDVILVMADGRGFESFEEVWNWIMRRMKKSLRWRRKPYEGQIKYHQDYLRDSNINFSREKTTIRIFSGDSGYIELQSIRHEIWARTSEWRSLPYLPNNASELESMFMAAVRSNGMPADNLSIRRASFALGLRDIEAYARALSPKEWKDQRHAFLDIFVHSILVLPTFFDFYGYLSRVVMLTVNCRDFAYLSKIIGAIGDILEQLADCHSSIKAQPAGRGKGPINILRYFKSNIEQLINESISCAFPLKLAAEERKEWDEYFAKGFGVYRGLSFRDVQIQTRRYIKQDLAYRPLKICLLPPPLSGFTRYPIAGKRLVNLSKNYASRILPKEVINGCGIIAKLRRIRHESKVISGLLFPTRPMSVHDLYFLHRSPSIEGSPFTEEGSHEIACCLLALRGFKPEKGLPMHINGDRCNPIDIQRGGNDKDTIRITITSWKTDYRSWVASVTNNNDPDSSRLNRLNAMLNNIIHNQGHCDYLILPELSIPPNWFLAIAIRLRRKGISIICGIEYVHSRGRRVRNQVWAALTHDALGFPTIMIYQQDKQHPALHEERELLRIGNKILQPPPNRKLHPPIIKHGDFQFAILVCSELTNIAYRNNLRGKIDALFVPEWNRDTETFGTLVESTALDIHSYIIQCNDREFGDSRIRAPYKDNWMRDIVRIKGGANDYFVTGEIDIQSLRSFQSSYRSPDTPFKPVPDGFQIIDSRKVTPS